MIPAGYRIVFRDEFDGPLDVAPGTGWGTLFASKWSCHTPYGGDFGDAWFSGPGEAQTANPFSVANSILTITAFKDPVRNHWRSGLLSSMNCQAVGFSLALGYWECKMKLPKGAGVWPAFWLCTVNNINKARIDNCVEVDILEAYGIDIAVTHQHVHVWSPAGLGLPSSSSHSRRLSWNPSDTYRVYSAWVKRDVIIFAIDGVVIWTTPAPPEASQPMYCMINLALGGGWPIDQTPDPSSLLVDYVRAYAPPQ